MSDCRGGCGKVGGLAGDVLAVVGSVDTHSGPGTAQAPSGLQLRRIQLLLPLVNPAEGRETERVT